MWELVYSGLHQVIVHKKSYDIFALKSIKFKKKQWLTFWWSHRMPLLHFIFQIPYGLYFSVIPSLSVLNQILALGKGGGGMGISLNWEPFHLSDQEYRELVAEVKETNLRSILKIKKDDVPDLSAIFDEQILSLDDHQEYLKKSREKYEDLFWSPAQKTNGV